MTPTALGHVRICDLGGQLAGAGATRFLAAFGAEVIRVEDPQRQGRWDHLRGQAPFVDERRGNELGGAFNNHNVGKKGITLDLRTVEGKDLLRRLVAVSDVVTENFSAGVMERLGFSYDELRAIRADVIYVSNSGFGHFGPYRDFKSWGPIVQAFSGLTFTSGLPGLPPAGWGFSFMDHGGADFMCIGILAALVHRQRTGEGQWVDMSCTDAGVGMIGLEYLDASVNGRRFRGPGSPFSNRSTSPLMVPHGIYRAAGDDRWVAIACRDDDDWSRLARLLGPPASDLAQLRVASRAARETELDRLVERWTSTLAVEVIVAELDRMGIPVANVNRPEERIDGDERTAAWGLWPTVHHREIGDVRVDGLPVHLSETDWTMARGAPCLGEHNDEVLGGLLGLTAAELDDLTARGVL